jgi:hypothetical protein
LFTIFHAPIEADQGEVVDVAGAGVVLDDFDAGDITGDLEGSDLEVTLFFLPADPANIAYHWDWVSCPRPPFLSTKKSLASGQNALRKLSTSLNLRPCR